MENRGGGEVVQEEERRNNAGPMSVGRYDVGNSVEVAAAPFPSSSPPPSSPPPTPETQTSGRSYELFQ